MSLAPAKVRSALLAIVAAPDCAPSAAIDDFSDLDWSELAKLSVQTRTAPLLHHVLTRTEVEVPAQTSEFLREAARHHALAALKQGEALARVVEALGEQGMQPIALKGASLAFRDYPQPQLRPLRDIDLLLPAEEAIAAREHLLSHLGFEPHPAAGFYGAEHSHQLPEIHDPASGLVVEFHHRIASEKWPGEEQLREMLAGEPQALNLMGQDLLVPSPMANFLHLVEHASIHHYFSNGPLILSDLHYLVTHHDLDISAVAEEAKRLGLSRAFQLLSAVAGKNGASWVTDGTGAVDPAIVEATEYALLCDEETSRGHAQMARQHERGAGSSGLLNAATRLLRPDRQELARLAGASPRSAKRWLAYPAWLGEKGGRFFASRRDAEMQGQHPGQMRLRRWLHEQS